MRPHHRGKPVVLVLDPDVREAVLALPGTVRRFTLMYLGLWTVLTLGLYALLFLLHGGKP